MSNVKRVYIATWGGNPLGGWREGSYQCGDEDLCGSGKCDVRRSYSSIVCMNNADIYVIYVLDSVITASTKPQDLKLLSAPGNTHYALIMNAVN
ncbi:hypothetical protein [Vulcanisaeta distributa]|uniref:hypothetical protein n=1 Tax=Vulcanisaeta distributa TaxID=164451 RepID=UPI0006D283DE|nr:hypothetical protein [Vulcanisaeta distributa]